jgi:hypothetical protein
MRFLIHACVALVQNVLYQCEACPWRGSLAEAVEHAVANQWDER